ncbi:hypothetical protein J3D54_003170 [Pseudomonas sp. GGS8]|uniref:hypothetical protein n=1 Tax=Pseudomonas sp. GGS8 TaxID=2817892 RepID=UPI0020A16AE0|nr:hypothetical protein [Pseudomonas sp. GGS8]MCP1444038.1 hypothetical protein [Pseudomonas sp. GGS8]
MDIQSAELTKLFVLYPMIIPGWVTPVKPDGIAHGGIPKALYDGQAQGLECLVDSWAELQLRSWIMAVDDRVNLYCNGVLVAGAGQTVKPGEEQLRQRLYLPRGYLMQGVNRLHYVVTRVSGNSEPSRDLLVLYHLRPADNLDLVIPADVLKDGVSAEQAAQGVPFGFTYANRRNYDRIEFLLGDAKVEFDVPDGTAPITHTLFTDTFREAGDNPKAVAEFYVIDQLGNRVKSPEKRLDIHLGRLNLNPPTLVAPAKSPIDVLAHLTGATVRIEFLAAGGNDQALLMIKNPIAGDKTFPALPFNQNKRANFKLTFELLLDWMGRDVELHWELIRDGQPAGTSSSLALTIERIVDGDARLGAAIIDQADSARVLDINEFDSDATITKVLWPFQGGNYLIDITVIGTGNNGTPLVIPVVTGGSLTSEEEINGFTRTLSRAQLLLLQDGSTFHVEVKAHFKGQDPITIIFPTSLSYTIKNLQPILSENFDHRPTQLIGPGGSISLDSMTITFPAGNGYLGITSLANVITGPYPQLPGYCYGQILEMHWQASGTAQHMHIRFNWGFSYVSFWCRFAQFNDISVLFLDKSGNSLNHIYLANNFGVQPVTYSTPSHNYIWGIEIRTPRMDLIACDCFIMRRK